MEKLGGWVRGGDQLSCSQIIGIGKRENSYIHRIMKQINVVDTRVMGVLCLGKA